MYVCYELNTDLLKLKKYISNYLGLIKFSHTIFAMPFAILGFFLAIHQHNIPFTWHLFFLIIACLVFARSAAMSFNRIVDLKFDKENERTRTRELPSNKISKTGAYAFLSLNIIFFILTTWFINSICFYLSPVALIVILGYSYTKRFTFLCHLILGIGLALAPIGAFLAVTGFFELTPILLSFAVFFWVSGFDIIYALQDVNFDKQVNLYSIPSYFGEKQGLKIARFIHMLSIACIFTFGILAELSILFYIGTFIFCGLLIYQHTLVKVNDLSKINLAFFTSNGIASIVFSIFTVLDFYYYELLQLFI